MWKTNFMERIKNDKQYEPRIRKLKRSEYLSAHHQWHIFWSKKALRVLPAETRLLVYLRPRVKRHISNSRANSWLSRLEMKSLQSLSAGPLTWISIAPLLSSWRSRILRIEKPNLIVVRRQAIHGARCSPCMRFDDFFLIQEMFSSPWALWLVR